jgi:hypothetical protein
MQTLIKNKVSVHNNIIIYFQSKENYHKEILHDAKKFNSPRRYKNPKQISTKQQSFKMYEEKTSRYRKK